MGISRILIANRGEIALRIVRACKELGIETVAVYSEADRNSLHLRYADETVCIGPAASAQSYLDVPRLISAAEIADVEAIHPGYGFLSESSHFAEICQSCNIKFIGPSPETIAMVGNKARAIALALEAKVPTVPGSGGVVESEAEALEIARRIGYPVLVKASAGGGGRGMRLAHNDMSLTNGFHAARREAEAAFKNDEVYLEKFIQNPRHVEVQILADSYGNVVSLGERDCSLQRRHQKTVEESPAPGLREETRKAMGKAARQLAITAGYESAGTVEFIVDEDQNFYFIEVNARVQVEHPVTECVTGIDIIREMIRIAGGEELGYRQDDVKITGHAMEFRINAEDPDDDFRPCPGTLGLFVPPGGPGVRWDGHVYSGYRIPTQYDSLLGKLIVHRNTRDEVICTSRRALSEFITENIKTTRPLFERILRHSDFLAGRFDTGFIERYF
ncbi:MAG: acetyl-CoA carboxylase biotin carboxylase subunit [Planctomycetota bacterium]|nr:MAG: acetyl-CoA carboxylase biotin carboxylase subunit [Planctomycetota bacterium]